MMKLSEKSLIRQAHQTRLAALYAELALVNRAIDIVKTLQIISAPYRSAAQQREAKP